MGLEHGIGCPRFGLEHGLGRPLGMGLDHKFLEFVEWFVKDFGQCKEDWAQGDW